MKRRTVGFASESCSLPRAEALSLLSSKSSGRATVQFALRELLMPGLWTSEAHPRRQKEGPFEWMGGPLSFDLFFLTRPPPGSVFPCARSLLSFLSPTGRRAHRGHTQARGQPGEACPGDARILLTGPCVLGADSMNTGHGGSCPRCSVTPRRMNCGHWGLLGRGTPHQTRENVKAEAWPFSTLVSLGDLWHPVS